MKLTPRNKLLLTVVLLVAVACLLGGLLVYPRMDRLSELDEQVAEAQKQIDKARLVLEQRQAVKNRAAQTDAELLTLCNGLPESPELPSFIIELQDATNEAGVEFLSLSPDTPTQNTGFASIRMKMDVAGSWSDVIDFMHRLSGLTRQVRLVEYQVAPQTAQGDGGSTGKVAATFVMEAYTLASADSAAAAAPAWNVAITNTAATKSP